MHRNGDVLPVAYFSRRLNQHERNYAITELECLAVVKSVEHFGHYLAGKKFTIIMDHKALEALQTSRRLTERLARWALTLQQYSYDVQYKSGAKHQNADGLSRQSWGEDEDTKTEQPTRTSPLQAGGGVEGPSSY